MKRLITADFRSAVQDFYELLNKGYPERRTRHLVADAYSLTKSQRSALLRGVFSKIINERRMSLRFSPQTSENEGGTAPLDTAVDFFNVVYTVMNYLFGRDLYLATDGYLRDNGRDFSVIYREEEFGRALRIIAPVLSAPYIGKTKLLIDAGFSEKTGLPVPLGDYGESLLKRTNTSIEVELTDRVDFLLSTGDTALTATADSHIIDRLIPTENTKIFDMARQSIEGSFSPDIPDLGSLLL